MMYESDTEGAKVESEDVGSKVYRGHLITWRTGHYLGFRDEEDRTSFRITSPEGASRRHALLRASDFDLGLRAAEEAVDRNLDRPAARIKPSDVERDIISRWVMAQEEDS